MYRIISGAVLLLITASLFAAIDPLVDIQLRQKGIVASEPCDDALFMRRLYLVMTGLPPTEQQSRAFLSDTTTSKRTLLIDSVLDSEACNNYLVTKWGDLLRIKSEFPSNLWPNAVQAYNRWLLERMRSNMPYDQFVRELLLSNGSNFRSPAVNFYRAFRKRTPEAFAQNTALLFLGQRKAPENSDYFFKQIRFKGSQEWKEEFIYINIDEPVIREQIRMPDGRELTLRQGEDFRRPYVEWLTSRENRQFARAFANRAWSWVMGRGIVDEPDDFRPDNQPSNPELLEDLTDQFIRSGMDIKALFRYILTSTTFQRSSAPQGRNDRDQRCFSHWYVRRMNAESIVDALVEITSVPDRYMSKVPEPYSYYPPEMRAYTLGDGTVTSSALELFGRPSRDVAYESNRDSEITSAQVLYLLNSSDVLKKIDQMVRAMEKERLLMNDVKRLTDKLYLMILSRFPTPQERKVLEGYYAKTKPSVYAGDVIWALVNSHEFLFIH